MKVISLRQTACCRACPYSGQAPALYASKRERKENENYSQPRDLHSMSRRFASLARQPVLCGYPTDAPLTQPVAHRAWTIRQRRGQLARRIDVRARSSMADKARPTAEEMTLVNRATYDEFLSTTPSHCISAAAVPGARRHWLATDSNSCEWK